MLDAKVKPLHGLPRKVVEERFDRFGGCARTVLEEDDNVFIKGRKRLEAALNSADTLSTLKINSDMKAIRQSTHLLPKMYPESTFRFLMSMCRLLMFVKSW